MTRKRKKPKNHSYSFFSSASDCCEWLGGLFNRCLPTTAQASPSPQSPNAFQELFETDTSKMSSEERHLWQKQMLGLLAVEKTKVLSMEREYLISKAERDEAKQDLRELNAEISMLSARLSALEYHLPFDETEANNSSSASSEEEYDVSALCKIKTS